MTELTWIILIGSIVVAAVASVVVTGNEVRRKGEKEKDDAGEAKD